MRTLIRFASYWTVTEPKDTCALIVGLMGATWCTVTIISTIMGTGGLTGALVGVTIGSTTIAYCSGIAFVSGLIGVGIMMLPALIFVWTYKIFDALAPQRVKVALHRLCCRLLVAAAH